MLRTRFAPSPTGHLHVGNACSALICQRWAERHHAELLLRIEDIDATRCRPAYAADLIDDLAWLGLSWHGAIRYQSQHLEEYLQALQRLKDMGMVYPCFCTRSDIRREIEGAGLAPHREDTPEVYPGTCRRLDSRQRALHLEQERPFAWRLDVGAALAHVGDIAWQDGEGQSHPVGRGLHDAVIGRKDIALSYHLAVVVDDAAQDITHVIRGEDLKSSTGLHRLLQSLLGLPSPVYLHHSLLCDAHGERLAKRNGAPSLQEIRTSGISAATLGALLLRADGTLPAAWTGLPRNSPDDESAQN